MEKLQVAIEQARQRRQGQKPNPSPTKKAVAKPAKGRDRAGPRLLPDGLAERWDALKSISLPRERGDARRLVSNMPGPEASHYDILRTKVLIELRKNGWRRIAITSPSSGCGKTTSAANLTLSISRQGDLRTALFDLDLRRPGIGRLFRHMPENDISEFVAGDVAYEDQAVCLNGNLAISMARQPQSDPTQTLAGELIAERLDEVEKEFAPDVMVFDLPPLLAADDARAFLRNVDCAILMAQAEVTTAHQIDICEREIVEQTNVLGVVLNQCRFDETRQDYSDY